MRLSKPVIWIVGIATVWSVVNPLAFAALVFVLPWDLIVINPAFFMASELVTFSLILVVLTIINQICLLVFYLFHIVKNSAAEESVRIVLGLGFFFMAYVAMPLYYYLYIWRDVPPHWAAAEIEEPELSEDVISIAHSPTIEELKEEEKSRMV